MKCLVCISRTPDTTAKISFSDDQKEFISDGVNFIMNPYDEWYALVRALELKEANGGSVEVIHVGTSAGDTIIRKALAIGADEAVRVDMAPQSSWDAAAQIAHYAKDKSFDIIFTGKETIDFNGSEVGAMIAEHLGIPFVSYASKLETEDALKILERDIEGGVEVVEVKGQLVVSASKGMAAQRIPNMRGIMMAKRKPLTVIEPISSDNLVEPVSFTKPPVKQGVKMVDPEDMDELVRLLHEEAKVI